MTKQEITDKLNKLGCFFEDIYWEIDNEGNAMIMLDNHTGKELIDIWDICYYSGFREDFMGNQIEINKDKEEISPVILTAVDLMKELIQGLEIELLGGMRRAAVGKDNDGIKLSPVGVSTKMTYIGAEKNVFLTYIECADMLGPCGDTLVNEFIMHIFKDELYIRDVEYVQKNLFEALKIPLDYLGSRDNNNKNDNK